MDHFQLLAWVAWYSVGPLTEVRGVGELGGGAKNGEYYLTYSSETTWR